MSINQPARTPGQLPRVVELICQVAQVPSFSSFEDCLHPLVHRIVEGIPGAVVETVPEHNLLVSLPGAGGQPVALTAHLDKIDHAGPRIEEFPSSETGLPLLPVEVRDGKLIGAMDDSAGVGLCLALAELSATSRFPPLWLLLSEMEESLGLRRHPERLVAHGAGRKAGQGAERLARRMMATGRLPALVLTIDTTPLFGGAAGRALYCAPWERHGRPPGEGLLQATADLRDELLRLDPQLRIANNGNDYVTYGDEFNRAGESPIPSVALEPSIFPYHQTGEEVFVSDILALQQLLVAFLTERARAESE